MGILIKDLSCAGMTINVGGVLINDFMDDENPVEFSDTEVSNIEFSCNGKMIRTVKPSPIIMSVTVIPGSSTDNQLYNLWRKFHLRHNDEGLTASIYIPNGPMIKKSYSFRNGTFLGGAMGPSPNGQGKARGRTYTFAFENVS